MNGEVCIPNIGRHERRRRLAFGIAAWVVAAAAMAAMVLLDVDRLWRLALFIPLWAGGLGFFQHREKT